MKKLVFSVVLVNLLAACGTTIHTPFDRASKSNQDATPQNTASETPKTDNVTAPEVNAQSLDKAATAETASSVDSAPKAETAAPPDAAPKAEASDVAKNDSLNDPSGSLSKRSVHFPFDADAIQDEDKSTIQAHGAFLSGHATQKVRTEGNTDERGSSEYNLALGQRRANHTRKALVLAGAKADQIEAISYGEEKPQSTGHDEISWAENRRADIVYK
jgi:peptidoglycan-associated lipoprotein